VKRAKGRGLRAEGARAMGVSAADESDAILDLPVAQDAQSLFIRFILFMLFILFPEDF
jgi:hypothetical protein